MKLSPRKARSDQFVKLNSYNKNTENHRILIHEDYVTITKQTVGESWKKDRGYSEIHIDKEQFNKLIDWYNREQELS